MSDTRITHGYLHMRERILARDTLIEESDVFLFVEGGEARSSFALSKYSEHGIKRLLRIRFNPPLAASVYCSKTQKLIETLKANGRCSDIDCEASTNVYANIQKISQSIEEAVLAVGAKRLCVDISTLPKVYFLSIMAWALKVFGLPNIRFVYSCGQFGRGEEAKNHFPGKFTEGRWELKQVENLVGPSSTDEKRGLFAFVGADINKAEEIFRRYEPLRKSLIYPDTQRNGDQEKTRGDLAKYFQTATNDISFCDRDSAVDALRQLRKGYQKVHASYGDGGLIFPFGTKLSAIACGVFAAFDPSIDMLVRVPEKYISMDVEPDGRIVVVDILDATHRDAALYL